MFTGTYMYVSNGYMYVHMYVYICMYIYMYVGVSSLHVQITEIRRKKTLNKELYMYKWSASFKATCQDREFSFIWDPEL